MTLAPLLSIRGYAALLLVLGHFHYGISPIPWEFFDKVTHYGMLFVDGFFLLSGFILTHVYHKKLHSWGQIKDYGFTFLLIRFARIYPLHLFTLALVILLHYSGMLTEDNWLSHNKFNTPTSLTLNIFLMQGWGIIDYLSWNQVSWSTSTEWLMYLLFPFLIPIFHRFRYTWLYVLVTIGIMTMLFFTTKMYPHRNINIPVLWFNEPLHSLPVFMVGICLGYLYEKQFLAKLPWDLLFLVIMSLCIWGTWERVPMTWMIQALPFIAYSLLFIRRYSAWIFVNKPALFLGEISYSIYMIHVPYISTITYFGFIEPQLIWHWYHLWIVVVLLVLSTLSYFFIEMPMRGLIRNWAVERYKRKNDNTLQG